MIVIKLNSGFITLLPTFPTQMTPFKSFFALALYALCLNAVGAFKPVNINDDNFDQLVSKGTWILEFYANWCGELRLLFFFVMLQSHFVLFRLHYFRLLHAI
jgi:hypothetical protein